MDIRTIIKKLKFDKHLYDCFKPGFCVYITDLNRRFGDISKHMHSWINYLSNRNDKNLIVNCKHAKILIIFNEILNYIQCKSLNYKGNGIYLWLKIYFEENMNMVRRE